MGIHEHDRRIARAMWRVAVRMIEIRDPDTRAIARTALERPCPETIRPLLEAGRGKVWLPSVIDALAQAGIAAAEDILGDEQ